MLRIIVIILVALCCLTTVWSACTDIFPACEASETCQSDGYCDVSCNIAKHQYDGGDCCLESCLDTAHYNCGEHHPYRCKDPKYALLEVDYERFILWMNCTERLVVRYRYTLYADRCNYKDTGYKFDERKVAGERVVPQSCQQQDTRSFRLDDLCPYGTPNVQENEKCFDQGHQVMKEHMDSYKKAMQYSNYVTNLVPQQSGLNQNGAWKKVEEIATCYADSDDYHHVLIVGGSVFDEGDDNDYFVESHGIRTPNHFWKVLMRFPTNRRRRWPTSPRFLEPRESDVMAF